MPDPVLPQDDLLASTMTHLAPAPNPLLADKGAPALAYELMGMPGQALLAPGRMVQSGMEEAYKGNYNPQDVTQQGQMAEQTTGLAMGLLGGASPFAEEGAVGIFAGRLAKTADLQKLDQAQKMLSGGATRKAIWDATGWFQGADGKWRFEIPDNASFYLKRGGDTATIGTRFYHPELFEAYPELENIELLDDPFMGTGGLYRAKPERISVGRQANEATVLHELTHAIQQREGFAKGGSPQSIKPIVKEALQAAGIPKPDKAEIDRYADEVYRRLAGEVEARNVEYRAKRLLAKNREFPPWITEDRPREKQTIIGLTPVDHDPFAGEVPMKLTPIEHDPFK